jgi:RNA polymerase II elongation factor ELL
MPSLVIPPSGLSLGNFPASSSKPGSAVPDVFGLTLTDSVIEEMIRCVQNRKPIQLSLGEHPVSLQFTDSFVNLAVPTFCGGFSIVQFNSQ